ncbi:MAG: hypothetical protein P3W95_009195 [Tepidimonas taiwanensis]|nr:hypothetical protein [Tepidimonas taiwanensis]
MMTDVGKQPFPWRRFLRRRFPVHAEGWVYAQVPLWWGALLLDPAPGVTVDVFYALACLIVAGEVVGALVGLAALLRFPWAALLPFCVLSMAVEAWWLRWRGTCWRDHMPQRKRWYLANPVAWWQGWWLKEVRIERRAQRALQCQRGAAASNQTALGVHAQSSTPGSAPVDNPCSVAFHASARARRHTARPEPDVPGPSAFDYAFDHFEPYMTFWYGLGFLALWAYVASSDQLGWLGGLFIALLLYGLASVTYVAFIPCAILGLASAWIVGAGLSPQQREAARPRYCASDAAGAAPPPEPVGPPVAPPARPRSATSWLLPLAIGLWIGSAWGDDA